MADNTSIEWTDATWNPVTGCTEVSPGCDRCYARTFAERWRGVAGHHFERGFDVQLRPERLKQPLRWRRPRRIFVNSMSDLFHTDVPDEYIARVFAVMALAPQHTFQVLTKRHGRMRSLLNASWFVTEVWTQMYDLSAGASLADRQRWPLPNVWLGVSIETQQWADIRVPALLNTPAAVRWVSCEPLLGALDLMPWLRADTRSDVCDRRLTDGWCGCLRRHRNYDVINWVVAGGESGPGARPMHPEWALTLRDQCRRRRTPFLFKQWGSWRPVSAADGVDRRTLVARQVEFGEPIGAGHGPAGMVRVGKGTAGRVLEGRTWDEYPGPAGDVVVGGGR